MRQVVDTPAGPLELVCQVDGAPLVLTQSRDVPCGVVERWTSSGIVDVTFVRADLDPPPFGTASPVDGYLGAVWTLTAHRTCGPITFRAHLTDPQAQQHLDPNNGEALEAVTYDRPGLALTIGTHDDEALATRATHPGPTRAGPPLPAAWASALSTPWQGEYGARSGPLGITVRLPPLPAGQRADIHVAVAWVVDRDDPDSWFAVDTDPGQILTEALGPSDAAGL